VIAGAALCPSPPLLCPQITGRHAVVPGLRTACAEVVRRLLRHDPEVIVIIGSAAATGAWDGAGWLNPSVFAPAIASTGTGSAPLALGLGAMLLDQAGYRGRRVLQAVGQDEPASACEASAPAAEDLRCRGRGHLSGVADRAWGSVAMASQEQPRYALPSM
jgi:hypothetical protein